MRRRRLALATFSIALAATAGAACASRAPGGALPAIPPRAGELALDVVYPPQLATIADVDSNFIFGSVGNGHASLSINGAPVQVEPNGSFLAWLPVPPPVGDTLAVYELLATLDGTTQRITHGVRLAGRRPPPDSGAVIDTARIVPSGLWWAREGELLPVRVLAAAGAQVRLRLPDGGTVPLRRSATPGPDAGRQTGQTPAPGTGDGFGDVAAAEDRAPTTVYEGTLAARVPLGRGEREGQPPPVHADAVDPASACAPLEPVADDVAPGGDRGRSAGLGPRCAVIEAVLDADTFRTALPLDLWLLREPYPLYEVAEAPSPLGNDGLVAAEAEPGGTVTWLWSDGPRLRVTGRRGETVRVRLDSVTEAWVALRDLRPLGLEPPATPVRVGAARFDSRPDRLRVVLGIERPVPYSISIEGASVALTLHGAAATSGTIAFGPTEPLLETAWWEQTAGDRYTLRVELSQRPWGYRVSFAEGQLRFDLRRPPPVDLGDPLRGRVIAIDPGHPPAGATGPTRLYEGDANLAVAYRVRRLLRAEGARVVMTRTDASAVPLYDRVALAELLGAEILISIHNNALPDGVEPFGAHGTSVYYFQAHEADLARALQEALLGSMGLRDLGVLRASLALARPTWLPSVLVEGAFMMIPAHEAALRNPSFAEAYARGVVDGLREFLRGRAR